MADVKALLEAFDEVVARDPALRRHRQEVTDAFDHLRELVDDDSWQGVLALEEILNARLADTVEIAITFAYGEGYRDGRRRRKR
jgi:hypothetical protein